MRRTGLVIGWLLCFVPLFAVNDTIDIPLQMTTLSYIPQDGPTGSTPDPTDPNQFRASLTGNTLLIDTQEGQVSYVVIQEEESEKKDEDYFYGLSLGSIQCPITHAGAYIIRIGYWKTDFTGRLLVKSLFIYDFHGHLVSEQIDRSTLPPGWYILRLETPTGTTTTKFYQLP